MDWTALAKECSFSHKTRQLNFKFHQMMRCFQPKRVRVSSQHSHPDFQILSFLNNWNNLTEHAFWFLKRFFRRKTLPTSAKVKQCYWTCDPNWLTKLFFTIYAQVNMGLLALVMLPRNACFFSSKVSKSSIFSGEKNKKSFYL